MSYITPDTIVHLLKGCPIDKDYTNTLYFKNETEQYNYFVGLKKHTLNNQTYQRWDKGSIRVNLLVDKVYDCNYMMFRNTSFGNKWFYAFIDSVEYVNNVTCTINYTIDVMQTWYFDYETGQCFVEREHSETDEIGDNYIEENLDTGELVIEHRYNYLLDFSFGTVIIAGIFDETDLLEQLNGITVKKFTKSRYTGMPNGLDYYGFEIGTERETEAFFKLIKYYYSGGSDIILKKNKIVKVFMIPNSQIPDVNEQYNYDNENYNREFPVNWGNDGIYLKRFDGNFGNYKPKNNKLYIYPYNSLLFTDNRGNEHILRYERFDNPNQILFYLNSNFSIEPSCMCYPTNYYGVAHNTFNKLIINDYPTISWVSDNVVSWLVNKGITALASKFTGNTNNTNTSNNNNLSINTNEDNKTESNIKNKISSVSNTMTSSTSLNCNSGNGGLISCSQLTSGFTLLAQRITGEYARIIDNYFTMFGYATKRVKIPNIRSGKIRPHFNYIKTDGCIIHPANGKGLPSEDEKLISQIYDKGITFWNNGNEVGDYSLDNSPIQGDE